MRKITVGFVVQRYDRNGVCIGQEFVSGDQVEYEDDNGLPITVNPDLCRYHPFDMVQPATPTK